MAEVPLRLVDGSSIDTDKGEWRDSHFYRTDLPAGTAAWLNGMDDQVSCLDFVCPCGCGSVSVIPVRPGSGSGHWNWNGDREKPSLTPSIQKTSPCRWHGYLTDGVFRSC